MTQLQDEQLTMQQKYSSQKEALKTSELDKLELEKRVAHYEGQLKEYDSTMAQLKEMT